MLNQAFLPVRRLTLLGLAIMGATHFAAVQAAQREMQWSSAAVPGLEMIAFSQGCCAMHRNQKIMEV